MKISSHIKLTIFPLLLILGCGPKKVQESEAATFSTAKSKMLILSELELRNQIGIRYTSNGSDTLSTYFSINDYLSEGLEGWEDIEMDRGNPFKNMTTDELLSLLGDIDDRKDHYLIKSEKVRASFKSVAVAIPEYNIENDSLITGGLLKDKMYPDKLTNKAIPICSNYHFAQQLYFAKCTAIPISPTAILTVAHEINNENKESFRFVFDVFYKNDGDVTKFPISIKPNNIFYPDPRQPAIVIPKSTESNIDYCIIKLDPTNPIPADRIPEFNFDSEYIQHDRIYAIGASLGMALKYSPGGFIQGPSDQEYFTANLNVQRGNSGSPVFDSNHRVIGMVVKGPDRLVYEFGDSEGNMKCVWPGGCLSGNCEGEKIMKISVIQQEYFD